MQGDALKRTVIGLMLTGSCALSACGSVSVSVRHVGGSSPGAVAKLYMAAILDDDTASTNALIASHRADCPPIQSEFESFGFLIPTAGESVIAHSTRDGRRWRVTLTVGDGDSSSSGSEIVVVAYQDRYYVC
jgi:hypothetical protein